MIEKIARHLCEADGYDPDIIGSTGNPRWWLYTRTAEHTLPLLVEAWDGGHAASELGWMHAWDGHPVPEGEMCDECGAKNPYRQEKDA